MIDVEDRFEKYCYLRTELGFDDELAFAEACEWQADESLQTRGDLDAEGNAEVGDDDG